MLKEALDFLVNLGEKNGKTEVLEICGKTYSTRELVRYDQAPKARPMEARSLRALTDYIEKCSQEFRGPMVVHVESPKKVRLVWRQSRRWLEILKQRPRRITGTMASVRKRRSTAGLLRRKT